MGGRRRKLKKEYIYVSATVLSSAVGKSAQVLNKYVLQASSFMDSLESRKMIFIVWEVVGKYLNILNKTCLLHCLQACKIQLRSLRAGSNSVGLTFSIEPPILAGLSVTMAPAFSRAATLSDAAPGNSVRKYPTEVKSERCTFASRDNSTCMPHTSARGSCASRDEADNRFRLASCLVVFL